MEARPHPDPRPRQVSRNLSNPLLLVSPKLLFANLCSQAPVSASNSGIWARTSGGSSSVLGSVWHSS